MPMLPDVPLTNKDTVLDVAMKMGEANPGALSVLFRLLKELDEGVIVMCHLDDMGIRGASIWLAFKDHCKEDLNKLAECAINRDLAMIETIKNNHGKIYERAN